MKKHLLLATGWFLLLSGIMLLYVKDRRHYIYEEFVYIEKLDEYKIKQGEVCFSGASVNIDKIGELSTGIYGDWHDVSNNIPKFTRYGYPYCYKVWLDFPSKPEKEFSILSVSIYMAQNGRLVFRDDTEKPLKIEEQKRTKYCSRYFSRHIIQDLYLPHVDLRVELEIKDVTEGKTEKMVFEFKAETRKESSSTFIDRIMSV